MSDYAYWKERAETVERELVAANARIADLEMAMASVEQSSAPRTRLKREAEADLADIHTQVEAAPAVEGSETPTQETTHV